MAQNCFPVFTKGGNLLKKLGAGCCMVNKILLLSCSQLPGLLIHNGCQLDHSNIQKPGRLRHKIQYIFLIFQHLHHVLTSKGPNQKLRLLLNHPDQDTSGKLLHHCAVQGSALVTAYHDLHKQKGIYLVF